MDLQVLIDVLETVEVAEQEAVNAAKDSIDKYLCSQTVTVQELLDIVEDSWRPSDSSSGQVSTWQILDIAKRAILNRTGE